MRVDVYGGGTATFEPGNLVRLSERPDLDAGDPPTEVVLDGGTTILASDGPRTIHALLGDSCPLCEVDESGRAGTTLVAIGKVALLTKASEDPDDEDPTLVHLANGEVLSVAESIRAMAGRLNAGAGIETVSLDLAGSERPAAVVPDHVESVSPAIGTGGATAVLHVAGSGPVETMDDPDRLSEVLEAKRTTRPAAGLAGP